MDEQLRGLGFLPVGKIVPNGVENLIFDINQDYVGNGQFASRCGWVYIWTLIDLSISSFNIVYVGKAGSTLRNRFTQHTNGFQNSSTGRRHADRIREYFAGRNPNQQLYVYARKSPDIALLGEAGISMCEAEERAMIAHCLRRRINLWNYQSNNDRNPKPEAYHDMPQHGVNGMEEGQGAPSREEAFLVSISGNPEAQQTVGNLLNALTDRQSIEIRYTFTHGADFRVRCLEREGRDVNFGVATIHWQPRREGFSANLYLSPEEALECGAWEARGRPSGAPKNVKSVAFFKVPDAGPALVTAVIRSITDFERGA